MTRLGLFAFALILLGQRCLAAEEVRLIVATRSTILSGEGYIVFDLYLINQSTKPLLVSAPENGFTVAWRLRDPQGRRADRDGSNRVMATHTLKPYTIAPRAAIRCELGNKFDSEPGDLLEFYIGIDTKVRKVKTDVEPGEAIRSNSVILYRPNENAGSE